MASFLELNQDYLLFVAGLAFAALGFVARGLARTDQQPAWHWLSWFAFAQSLHAWVEMTRQIELHFSDHLALAEILLLELSGVFLIEFARTFLASRRNGRPGRWLHLPLIAASLGVSFIVTRDFAAGAPVLLNALGGIWAASVLWSLLHTATTRPERVRWRLAALALLAGTTGLAAASQFVRTPIDPESSVNGFPSQVLIFANAVLACVIAATLGWCYSKRAQRALSAERVAGWRHRRTVWILAASVVIAIGWIAAETVGFRRDQTMRRDALARCQLAAAAVPADLARSLDWSERDLESPAYQSLKTLMMSLVKANPDLRFVLLAGHRDNQSFFLVDSAEPTSDDYSPPGQPYTEADPRYLKGMASARPFILGPVRDRWGVWIIASVPLLELGHGRGSINAEIDIAADDWNAAILRARLPVAVIVLLILSLLLLSFYSQERVREQMDRLALSERLHATLVEGSPNCVQMLDTDGRCLTVNRNGLTALGRPASRVIGRPFAELWPESVRPLVVTALRETSLGKPALFDADYLRPDGGYIIWRVATNPVRDNAGRIRSLVCICTDITAGKLNERTLLAAKESAESADRAKSEFLAVMSHEIRTPLGGVIGMLDILQRHPQPPDQRRYTGMARGAAESLLEILDDILDAAKVESGKLHLETIPFRPRDEFLRVLEVMNFRASAKNLTLTWNFDPALPAALLGDPTRLRQILANLLSNAIKFTARGGVSVEIARAAEVGEKISLRIQVRDTGIGLLPEAREKLFQKFVQADASTSRSFGGTGLGLSIVKGLVDQMHGAVSVESQPGQGSTFTIDVPLAIATGTQPAPASVAESLPAHSRKLRLLYAEDDLIHREIALSLATAFGHEIVFAHNGAEALEKLHHADFDAVLMDNRMPVMDGFQATRAIRAGTDSIRRPLVPIIAVTANASLKYRDECLAAGMNDFLTKPLRPAAFHRILSDLIARESLASNAQDSTPAGLTEAELLALLDEPPASRPPVNPKLVALFFEETPRRFLEMHTALNNADAATFARAAHSLKSTSAYADALDLGEIASELEKLADDAQLSSLAEPLARAEQSFTQLLIRNRASGTPASSPEHENPPGR